MYEKNGITYANNKSAELLITEFKPLYDGILLLTFSTGERRLFDTTVLIEPVFEPLKDKSIALNPELFHGILTWLDGTIDISPEATYELSYKYNTQDIMSA